MTLIKKAALTAIALSITACSDQKLISDGGMPAPLQKVKCGSSSEELFRAYPDMTAKGASGTGFCRVTAGVEKDCVTVTAGKVSLGMVLFLSKNAPAEFGTYLERLEGQLGKGVFDSAEKSVRWKTDSGRLISLSGEPAYVSLGVACP